MSIAMDVVESAGLERHAERESGLHPGGVACVDGRGCEEGCQQRRVFREEVG